MKMSGGSLYLTISPRSSVLQFDVWICHYLPSIAFKVYEDNGLETILEEYNNLNINLSGNCFCIYEIRCRVEWMMNI